MKSLSVLLFSMFLAFTSINANNTNPNLLQESNLLEQSYFINNLGEAYVYCITIEGGENEPKVCFAISFTSEEEAIELTQYCNKKTDGSSDM